MAKQPIHAKMWFPPDVNIDDIQWFPDEEPVTPAQKEKAERAWDAQKFGNLTVKEAKYMLQRCSCAAS